MPASSAVPSHPSSLDSINERDLDLVLMIALHSSPAFRAALVKRLEDVPIAGFIGARRGVYDQQGETDILLEVRTESGERLAILIEDKIDASFQPRQAERCRLRGEMGKTRGNWDRSLTCLCAPKRYAELYKAKLSRTEPRIDEWDRVLFLEDVADMLATHDEPFAAYLSSVLRQAVEKHERAGFVPNLQATAFWKRYGDLNQLEFRDLRMSPLPMVSSANDPWPRFLATMLPPDVKLEHKVWKGHVDLTFQRRGVTELAERLADVLPQDLELCLVRPSAAVRAIVPRLVATQPFDSQVEAVRASFEAVRRLAAFWPRIRQRMGYHVQSEAAAIAS
jgi:hypothetical protein